MQNERKMKKLFILLLLTATKLASLQAQVGVWGFAGANISNVHFPDSAGIDEKYESNFSAGFSFRKTGEGRISYLADLAFAPKGYSYSVSVPYEQKVRFRYFYLDLAPQLQYRLTNVLSISAGPYGSLKLKERINAGDGWKKPLSLVGEFRDDTDFGFIASARAGFGQFTFALSYLHGLQNVSDINFTDENGVPIVKAYERNRAVQLTLGYRFWQS